MGAYHNWEQIIIGSIKSYLGQLNLNWVQQITFGCALTIFGGSTNYMPFLIAISPIIPSAQNHLLQFNSHSLSPLGQLYSPLLVACASGKSESALELLLEPPSPTSPPSTATTTSSTFLKIIWVKTLLKKEMKGEPTFILNVS